MHKNKSQRSENVQKELKAEKTDAQIRAILPMAAVVTACGSTPLALLIAALQGKNELKQYIRDQKNLEFFAILKEGDVSAEDFKQGGVMEGVRRTYDCYMLERNEEKRSIIKRIFLGFISSADRDNFQVEKMYRIMDFLDLTDIVALKFIHNSCIPQRYKLMRQEYESKKRHSQISDVPFEDYFQREMKHYWLLNKYDDNHDYKFPHEIHPAKDNLERWGIIEASIPAHTWQEEGVKKYRLTHFGFHFCLFVSEDDEISHELKKLIDNN